MVVKHGTHNQKDHAGKSSIGVSGKFNPLSNQTLKRMEYGRLKKRLTDVEKRLGYAKVDKNLSDNEVNLLKTERLKIKSVLNKRDEEAEKNKGRPQGTQGGFFDESSEDLPIFSGTAKRVDDPGEFKPVAQPKQMKLLSEVG